MWNDFEVSATEDETMSDTFSSRGVFKIRSEEEVTIYPNVLASMQNQKVVIAIDKSFVLLEDEMLAKYSFLNFNANIDAFALSASGNLIICGLSNGEVHGIHIKGVPLFNLSVQAEDVQMTGKTFSNLKQSGKSFHLVCTNSSIYRLSEIDESLIEKNLNVALNENDNVVFDDTILENINLECLCQNKALKSGYLKASIFLQQNWVNDIGKISKESGFQLIAGSSDALYFNNIIGNTSARIILSESYGGCKYIYNLENFVLLLTNSGHLLEICPITKIIKYCRNANTCCLIDELIVMECNDEQIELLILTKPSKADDTRLIQFVEYPSFKCLSELDVGKDTWLIYQPKGSVNLYYVKGKSPNLQNFPTEIELVLVSETHPSERFKKLIAKGHLEEAEMFGQQFELCLQPIYEAKARRLIIDLNCYESSDNQEMEERFEQLLQLLKKIENRDFFRNSHMIYICSRKLSERFLLEMQQHLNEEDDEKHILDIREELRRIETLKIIDPYECDASWQKFVYNLNLVPYLMQMLKTDVTTACLIWKRHSCSLIPYLNSEELQKLLTLIPKDTEAFSLLQWLRQFVLVVCNTHPNVMPYITEWCIEKTRNFQYSEHWPVIGLEFATKVHEVFEEIEFLHSDVNRQHELNIDKLNNLMHALQDLSVLQKIYNLTFTLDNYLQDSFDQTALCILQGVNLVNIKSLVNDFLYPIFQEKGMSAINALCRYIKLLVASRSTLSAWLERAVACIELLHNEDDRLQSALSVLQSSPVPWPDTVAPLIKFRYSTHPLASKINDEFQIQVIKVMKVKYGWPTDSGSDINLQLFMFRIIKMDLPDMLDDIRTLTKVMPEIAITANFNCCYHLVKRGRPDAAYEFFKSLIINKTSKTDATITNIIELFASILEDSPMHLDEPSVIQQKNLIEFYKQIVKKTGCSSAMKRSSYIENRFILFYKYNLKVNDATELVSHERRMQLLEKGIEQIIENCTNTVDSCKQMNFTKYIIENVFGLCSALQIQNLHGLHIFCSRLRNLLLTCSITNEVLQLKDCCKENYTDFINLALELIVQQIVFDKHSTVSDKNKDFLAFPLARELLVLASLYENKQPLELLEIIKYLTIIDNCYAVDAIEIFYKNNCEYISDSIYRQFEILKVKSNSCNESASTINSSNFIADTKSTQHKKRQSVSVFDEIEVQSENQQHHRKQLTSNDGQIPVVNFIAHALLMFLLKSSNLNNPLFLKLKKMLLAADPTALNAEQVEENFFSSLEYLVKTKVHDVWYIMMQYFMDYQAKHDCRLINEQLVSALLIRVFRNALSGADVNFVNILTMLNAHECPVVVLDKLEVDIRNDQQKLNFLILLEMHSMHLGNKEHTETIRLRRIKHFYYMELCKQDPSIKGKFNADTDNINQLLKEFHNKQLDVHLLERMATDFNLDYDYMLVTQIISILQNQQLQYEIKTDVCGDEELVILSNADHIRSLCDPYVNKIKNTELLKGKLKQFIPEINFYFYELYLCVIDILSFIDAPPTDMQMWTSILLFLKHKMIHRRRNRPGQYETDTWLQSQTEIGIMPKIARYRLPFRPIVEKPLKDILDNEIFVENCESWFTLIELHTALKGSKEVGKMRDYFCMQAVKNSISEYKSKTDLEIWHLQPTNNGFLNAILRLIEHIESPSKAFVMLYFVSNYAPDGADQVEATYECYKYALKNEALITDAKYHEQVTKIKRKYPILKTQHLLYVYGIKDEKLLHLVENPTELIYYLYNHESILKASKLDINKVIQEISELHNINLEAIQLQLLQKWLSFTMGSQDGTVFEDTFLEDQNVMEGTSIDTSNAAENVIRANYILNSWPKEEAIKFLIGHIYPEDGNVNISKQLQMYECLSKLNDGDTSLRSVLKQREYIAIKCVHELKQLGYNSSIEKFAACNKIDILKTIWQHKAKNPNALETLGNICIGYNIYLARIWNGILKRMIIFNMVRELNALVDMLSCQAQLLNTDGLISAWDYVLKLPFKSANQNRTFEQEEKLHKALLRLQMCPVLHNLNLLEFAELSIVLDRPHVAAIIMALCKNPRERAEIEKLILPRKTEKLRQEIVDLEDAGILPVILNDCLKTLDL